MDKVYLVHYHDGYPYEGYRLLCVCGSRPVAEAAVAEHKETRDRNLEFDFDGGPTWNIVEMPVRQ